MGYKVTLIPGDGVGPEVITAAKKCIDSLGIDIKWEEVLVGQKAQTRYGCVLPHYVLESIRKNKVALKGPIITPIAEGFRSVNVELRQKLELFACVRPVISFEGANSKYRNIDIVIIRENTEGLYAGIEFEKGAPSTKELIKKIGDWQKKFLSEDTAISLRPISAYSSERIIRYAFEYALKNKRKKLTVVHKANILKESDGLFLNTARRLSEFYKDRIEFEEIIVDNLAMQLVLKPERFDILVLPNLYGDIISDLCAGIVGGLGLVPGANIGEEIGVFEPIHGAAPKYSGLNKVNPTAMILSAALMLEYLGEFKASQRLKKAVKEVIKEAKYVTYDLKPDRNDPTAVGTQEMAEAICQRLKQR